MEVIDASEAIKKTIANNEQRENDSPIHSREELF